MQPLLFDEGLPSAVADALAALGLHASAVGNAGAPPKQSSDDTNCQWCQQNGAVLVTNDRGKKDKTIFNLLAQHHVHAIFVHNDLRHAECHQLARAVLASEVQMDQIVGTGKLIHHRLRPGGGLAKR